MQFSGTNKITFSGGNIITISYADFYIGIFSSSPYFDHEVNATQGDFFHYLDVAGNRTITVNLFCYISGGAVVDDDITYYIVEPPDTPQDVQYYQDGSSWATIRGSTLTITTPTLFPIKAFCITVRAKIGEKESLNRITFVVEMAQIKNTFRNENNPIDRQDTGEDVLLTTVATSGGCPPYEYHLGSDAPSFIYINTTTGALYFTRRMYSYYNNRSMYHYTYDSYGNKVTYIYKFTVT